MVIFVICIVGVSMSKMKKIVTALCLAGVGAVALWGTQWVMHKTSTPEFCESCHYFCYLLCHRHLWHVEKRLVLIFES